MKRLIKKKGSSKGLIVDTHLDQIKKEGWFKKKGKKRYFVLTSSHLCWFTSPDGEMTGQLDLKSSKMVIKNEEESLMLELPNSNVYKLYLLEKTDNWASILDEWVAKIRECISLCFATTQEDEKIEKTGFLIKKGKQRWFWLLNETLSWFVKPQDKNDNWFKNLKGSLNLSECYVDSIRHPTAPGLVIGTSKKEYSLIAADKNSAESWKKAVHDVIEYLKATGKSTRKSIQIGIPLAEKPKEQNTDTNTNTDKPVIKRTESFLVTTPKKSMSGYLQLKKKGVHFKRFACIQDAMFLWFKGDPALDNKQKPSAQLKLEGCTLHDEVSGFSLETQFDVKHCFKTDNESELIEWKKQLQTTINTANEIRAQETQRSSGFVSKKGKKRWLVIKHHSLFWFSEYVNIEDVNKKKSNGSMLLANCKLHQNPDLEQAHVSFVVKNEIAEKSYLFLVDTQVEKFAWMTAIQGAITNASLEPKKTGWLSKKGKNRYFELRGDILLWFSKENINEELNGSLNVQDCILKEEEKNEKFNPENPTFEFSLKYKSSGLNYLLISKDETEFKNWMKVLNDRITIPVLGETKKLNHLTKDRPKFKIQRKPPQRKPVNRRNLNS